jgi:hypothetical protein
VPEKTRVGINIDARQRSIIPPIITKKYVFLDRLKIIGQGEEWQLFTLPGKVVFLNNAIDFDGHAFLYMFDFNRHLPEPFE